MPNASAAPSVTAPTPTSPGSPPSTRPPYVVLSERGDHEHLAAGEDVLPGGQRGIVAGPLPARRGSLVGGPLVAIPYGVVEGLPRVGHRPHERARVLAGEGAHVEVE